MWRNHHFFPCQQFTFLWWLLLEDVQCRSCYFTALYRIVQRILVYYAPACTIYHTNSVLHQRELFRAYQVMGVLGQWGVERNKIGDLKGLIQTCKGNSKLFRPLYCYKGVVGNDFHRKPFCSFRNFTPHSAHTDYAQRLAVYFHTHVLLSVPLPRFDRHISSRYFPR